MNDITAPLLTEDQLTRRVERLFAELGDRCQWAAQVRMLCWTHASLKSPATLRIDYVMRLDGGPLLGLELKAAPSKASDLGRAMLQAAQYAAGIVGTATVDRVPAEWVGKPLHAVFVYSQWGTACEYMASHIRAAHRLFGPANVGIAGHDRWQGFKLALCGTRYWSERYSAHEGLKSKASRSGNGSYRPESVDHDA